MTTLLVMTVGQSDVQLVIDRVRLELEPRQCGVLHDEIERRGYRLVDVPRKTPERKEALPDGDLTLCTPKLDAVLRYLDGKSELPSAAVIFDTRRTLKSDPRLAGAVLERRLSERGVRAVRRSALLTGEDRLEDTSDPQDAVVRSEVVEGVVRVLAEEVADAEPDNVVAATTGGLAAANAVIEEVVRLFAVVGHASVQVLEVPDGRIAGKDDEAVPERFHPATGFRARWQALSLIEGGNLLGAWGAVSHLAREPGQDWTKVIDWLRCFAASLPMPDDCDVLVLKHPRMAVRAALRVELALRAKDIPRAVHGTVAFFEAALWDWLRQRDFSREDGISGGSLESGFTFQAKPRGNRFHYRKNEQAWRVNDFKGGIEDWLSELGKRGLSNYWSALSENIRDLRNDVAHNEPTPELMDDARIQMRSARLWSDRDTFLRQPLAEVVLAELGEPRPGDLLQDLLDEIRRRLIQFSARPDLVAGEQPGNGASQVSEGQDRG